MSWIRQNSLSWIQSLGIRIIRAGCIPKHIAFIMDGNRRYAEQHQVQKIEGHARGFDKLAETLQWCLDLGVKEVTVYAFSIENFKRTPEEVDSLMELAKQKFQRLLDEKEKLMEHGVCVRVIGNLQLIRDDVRKLIAESMVVTKNNNQAFLNVAFAYTGTDDMTQAVQTIASGAESGLITPQDVTADLISDCLYTYNSPAPDLLVRTSGEIRLSDFLLWETSCSCLYFADVLWPDFTVWHLLAAVFYYQRCKKDLLDISETERKVNAYTFSYKQSLKVESFTDNVHKARLKEITTTAAVC